MIGGASWDTPSCRSSATTPTTSRHGLMADSRTRLPTASAGVVQYARASRSFRTTTGANAYTSGQVKARPATTRVFIVSK